MRVSAAAVFAVVAAGVGISEARRGRVLACGRWGAFTVATLGAIAAWCVPVLAYAAAFYGYRHRSRLRAMLITAADQKHAAISTPDARHVRSAGGFFGHDDSGHPVRANPRGAALVVGPPGSGKTRGVVMNSVAAAPAACVSTSIKTEVLVETGELRAQYGRCWWFDPGGTAGPPPARVEAMRWNPLCDVNDWTSAMSVAARLTGPMRDTTRGGSGDHWVDKAESWCAALLYAADRDLRLWAKWCRLGVSALDEASDALSERVSDIADRELEGLAIAQDVIAGLKATEAKELSGIGSTVSRISKLYNNPAALAAGDDPNFDPHQFVRSSDTLYISASTGDVNDYAPLLAGILESIRDAQEKRCQLVQLGHEQQTTPITFVLDEATNTAPVPLPSIASTAGGQGLHLVVAVQEPNQVRARWGQAGDGFLTLFPEILVLSGMRDERWSAQISKMSGEYDRMTSSLSTGQRSTQARPGLLFNTPTGVSDSGPGVTYQTQRTTQLSIGDVANIPAGKGLYLHQQGWRLLNLCFYTQAEHFREPGGSPSGSAPAGHMYPPLKAPREQVAGSRSKGLLTGLAVLVVLAFLGAITLAIVLDSGRGTTATSSSLGAAQPSDDPTSTPVPTPQHQDQISPPDAGTQWYWDGNWIRDYHEVESDRYGQYSYWVVQPASNGIYALKVGWVSDENRENWDNKAEQFSWPTDVILAVLDNDRILSEYNKYGDLELVGLRESCTPQGGWQEGALPYDCMIEPES